MSDERKSGGHVNRTGNDDSKVDEAKRDTARQGSVQSGALAGSGLLPFELRMENQRLRARQEHHEYLLSKMEARLDSALRERDDLLLAERALREALNGESSTIADAPIDTHAQRAWSRRGSGVLRMAGIMDEFTTSAMAHSCVLCPVDLVGWQAQLEAFRPQILFVESAWQGNNGQWAGRINHPSRELVAILEWCRRTDVPTIFWNKEDPVHFDTFINTARLFEHVFTTDIDCIARYKTVLRHDRVHLLPFWGQPRLHNPIERFDRKHAFCFAGAYYTRYPERQRDFDGLISAARSFGDVEIFDRNHGKDDANYQFPEGYRELIQGSLPYAEIDRAYKGYDFGINLNSVKQSQSMFARRVFDLMLSNTLVLSNYSRGLRLMFGDLVIATDDQVEMARRLAPVAGEDPASATRYRQRRLMALRKTMLEHTADHRLTHILNKVGGPTNTRALPRVVVVAVVEDASELRRVRASYERQSWSRKRLVLVLAEGYRPNEPIVGRSDIQVATWRDSSRILPAEAWSDELVAVLSPSDFHGEHYLTDAALAFVYASADVVGKGTWYSSGTELELHDPGSQYRWVDSLPLRRSVAMASAFAGSSLAEWLADAEERTISGVSCLSIDEFNYVADHPEPDCPLVDEPRIDQGLSIDRLLEQADSISGAPAPEGIEAGLDAAALLELFGGGISAGAVRLCKAGDAMLARSELPEGQHKYLYAQRLLDPAELTATDELRFHLVATPGLRLEAVFLFQDAEGERLGQVIKPFGRNHACPLPEGTQAVRFGLRILGPGSSTVQGLSTAFIAEANLVAPSISRTGSLVLTNIYPSPAHLYRNAFVHRRVASYREAGLPADVFVFNERTRPHAYEFEGVDANVGGSHQLHAQLAAGDHESILIHFLDPGMWTVVRERLGDTRVMVWIHGSEIQPSHRRDFNYTTDEEREAARKASDVRTAFWREVFGCRHPNLHFIFVSDHFAAEAMHDVGVALAREQYSVIHNFIDADLFQYREKPPEQRFKVLSIRPYASRTYANDLSVKAILALRDHPLFERMTFHLVGDGVLFDETLAPLDGLANVHIQRGFLSQAKVAKLHREYGIFLAPSRMDSQGVSRDEAMASGLVPVTSAVAAIPEFVDDSCGVLAPPEDWEGLAKGIALLAEDADRFHSMSREAAARVRRQSGRAQTLGAEIDLIRNAPDPGLQ
ncbi:glycosyltransferase family protein [Lysobacter sp. F6437]|uniref:glycosyltransferase family protein n=1 Tax=Lysobacter sp. F6437 TaxID=3459296 RepID=UPI00403E05BD